MSYNIDDIIWPGYFVILFLSVIFGAGLHLNPF